VITREQIPTLLDHPVFDTDGNKIGEAKHIFYDDVTGQPDWVTVKTGWFGSHESFVPIHDASMVGDHLEVPYDKTKVKDAPHVDVDAGGHLSEQEEHRLYDYYGIDWDDAWRQANAPGEGGWARDEETGITDTMGTTGTAGTTAAPDTTGTTGVTGARGRARAGEETDDAMTRSEEHIRVGVERHEAGRARLRKYVVTEHEEISVPVRHEEVRLEREPITEANRGDALAGPEISEAEHEVVLHEERPVVETRAEPVERVRLTTEEHVEEETVGGDVRKERIEAEIPERHIGEGEDKGDEGGDTRRPRR
jgi:stress response protein YsnF